MNVFSFSSPSWHGTQSSPRPSIAGQLLPLQSKEVRLREAWDSFNCWGSRPRPGPLPHRPPPRRCCPCPTNVERLHRSCADAARSDKNSCDRGRGDVGMGDASGGQQSPGDDYQTHGDAEVGSAGRRVALIVRVSSRVLLSMPFLFVCRTRRQHKTSTRQWSEG